MHLNENALLKNEMKDKLLQIEHMGSSLSQPKIMLAKNLGLMSPEDSWKSTFKDWLHEDPEEAKKKEE